MHRRRGLLVVALGVLTLAVVAVGVPTLSQRGEPATASTGVARLGSEGAVPLGQAIYPVPPDGVFVASDGVDTSPGTLDEPLRTVQAALERAGAGGTIVLREGVYHEHFTIEKPVTLQNYPGEQVWFDGSQPVAGFVSDGDVWRKDGWTAQFDSSASFKRGQNDHGFLNEDYPMAAHPDQVWVGGVAQRQVGSRADVEPGTFYVDHLGDSLFLGTSPGQGEVRASTLGRAIEVRAEGSIMRGVGVRRYAPSLPDMGTVTVERPRVTVENLHLVDNSTVGISLLAEDIVARQLTVQRNGLLGIHTNYADGLDLDRVLLTDNNTEKFNRAPSAGGIKITRAHRVTLNRLTVARNEGPGIWLDQSVVGARITNSVVHDNAGHGMFLEISADVVVAGNIIRDNGRFGIKVNNTSDVELWNNTVVRNDRPVNVVQDDRRGHDLSVEGQDPRFPGTLTWLNGPVTVRNNVLSAVRGECLLCVEDYSDQYTAEQFGVSSDNNVFYRATASRPRWLVVWSRGSSDPAVFGNLAPFQEATGQERGSLYVIGTEVVDERGNVTFAVSGAAARTAAPIPQSVAQLIGLPTNARVLGAPSAP